ncbi:hypothetical protein QPL79_00895 [Ignisphaera sp. 4213-co]|uniref:Glycoside hydrolase family 57 N-terminal domain-containing protein n=1 Tax=Ignisphaera cupida TaxID=3050454 RepID=A0ABD4Z721_9CREN|nr:hypothetical protein [Ignisphaera sp. 4213-co]MDK6027923.1 hypothetical protein [Ignisphaera sp. 4213-co]
MRKCMYSCIGFVFVLLLLISTTLSMLSNLLLVHASTEGVKLFRTPLDVCSSQPVLVFAYAPNAKTVELEVSVTIKVETNFTELALKLLQPVTVTYKVPAIPLPWEIGWYMAYIPGLPSKTIVFTTRLLLRTVAVRLAIGSSVLYKLVVDGVAVASDSYTVKEFELARRLPPLVYAFLYDVLKDPSIVADTFGLGPRGWVVGGGENVKILVVAFDESDRPGTQFEYRVDEGSWFSVSAVKSNLMSSVENIVNEVNNAIESIENVARSYKQDLTLPRAKLTISILEATIPPQNPGTYVMFRAVARDVDGNVATSPIGFYYVANKNSDTRVLVIDPHVWLWLFKENLANFEAVVKANMDYSIPDEVSTPVKRVANFSRIAKQGLVLFHHWEYLGKYYNIYIAWPKSDLVKVLSIFRPNVVILSSLGLGVSRGGVWNWDLRDIVVDGKPLLDHIISYVKQNHAGVIATHSTLSDEIVWLDCEVRIKLGARGHVGYDISDVDISNEKTVAALLGMPELAIWEFARDKIAETICNLSKAFSSQPQVAAALKIAAIAIGSTPLQVPHVPWNGTLRTTPEARDLGWDIPEVFDVEIPVLLNEFGFKAYTEVGWQLAFPRVLAYVAWDSTSKAREIYARVRDRLGLLYENISVGVVRAQDIGMYLDRAIDRDLRRFYKVLSSAHIRGTVINISMPIPEIGKNLSVVIDIGEKALSNILMRFPTRVVALSPNGLAGIIVHDKYWDPNGYRAVYFSFEVEAGKGAVVEKLLMNSVEWVKKWRYLNVTELLGGLVRVSKDVANRFRDAASKTPGKEVLSKALMLNEEGASEIELNLAPGVLHLVIAHPTTENISINVVRGLAEIINISKEDLHITHAIIRIRSGGTIAVSLRAGSLTSLNSAYVLAKHEEMATPTITTTQTQTVTTTITTTTTVTIATTITLPTTVTITTTTTTATTLTTTKTITTTVVETTTATAPTTLTYTTTVPTTKTISITTTTPTTVYAETINWGVTAATTAIAVAIAATAIYFILKKR